MLVQATTAPSVASGTPAWLYIIGAIGAAVVAGLVSYGIARRTSSGRIDTTEAATLWEEATKIRSELRDETVSLRDKVEAQAGRIDALEKENQERMFAERECREREAELRNQVGELRGEVNRLKRRRRAT